MPQILTYMVNIHFFPNTLLLFNTICLFESAPKRSTCNVIGWYV